MKANAKIRNEALRKGVYLWEIAAELGISDVAFSKKLRFERGEKETERIMGIIDAIAIRKAEESNGRF